MEKGQKTVLFGNFRVDVYLRVIAIGESSKFEGGSAELIYRKSSSCLSMRIKFCCGLPRSLCQNMETGSGCKNSRRNIDSRETKTDLWHP